MSHRTNHLTPTEWQLMECLWEKHPRTGREAVDWMTDRHQWSRSTTLTMLRRMTEKVLIACNEESGVKEYSPLIHREEAVLQETEGFLNRVYHGSVSLMMSALTRHQSLTREEIVELYEILRQAEEGNQLRPICPDAPKGGE